MGKIWVANFGEDVEHAYSTAEKAYDAAYQRLLKWGYCPDNEDEKLFFDELKQTYEDEECSGFYVDEVLWCWEVPLD